MGPMAERPVAMPSRISAGDFPAPQTAPRPVMTTRRGLPLMGSAAGRRAPVDLLWIAEREAAVRPAEAEGVGKRHPDPALARRIAHDFDIAVGIDLPQVGVYWQGAVMNGERADRRLHGARG